MDPYAIYLGAHLKVSEANLARKTQDYAALHHKLEEEQARTAELEGQLDAQEAENEVQSDQIADLEEQLGASARQLVELATARREIKDLRAQLAAQAERLAQLGNAKEASKAHTAAAYKKTRKLNTGKILEQCADVHDDYSAVNAELRAQLDQTRWENRELLRDNDKLCGRLVDWEAGGASAREWQSKYDKMRHEAETLRAQLDQLECKTQEASTPQHQLGTNMKETATVQSQLATKTQEASSLQAKLTTQTKEAAKVQSQPKTKVQEARRLHIKLAVKAKEAAASQAQLAATSDELVSLKAKMVAKTKEVSKLKSELEEQKIRTAHWKATADRMAKRVV
jgi:predicted RNase H-like nuclease (RuvC/YqgF family)